MTKMNNKWIAICSAAIGVIYSAGYVVTDTANSPTAQAAAQTHTKKSPSNKASSGSGQLHKHHRSDHHDHSWKSSHSSKSSQSSQSNSSGSGQSQNTAPSQTPSHKSKQASKSSSTYKDGTYNGTGMNRYGVVQVSVTIKGGKINAVQITGCRTHYPQSDIQSLPQQVVSNQTWNVDIVSGATGSSDDFRQAVLNALQQAMQA